jgi:hypothetical protein
MTVRNLKCFVYAYTQVSRYLQRTVLHPTYFYVSYTTYCTVDVVVVRHFTAYDPFVQIMCEM